MLDFHNEAEVVKEFKQFLDEKFDDETYDDGDRFNCAFGQFLQAMGFEHPIVDRSDWAYYDRTNGGIGQKGISGRIKIPSVIINASDAANTAAGNTLTDPKRVSFKVLKEALKHA